MRSRRGRGKGRERGRERERRGGEGAGCHMPAYCPLPQSFLILKNGVVVTYLTCRYPVLVLPVVTESLPSGYPSMAVYTCSVLCTCERVQSVGLAIPHQLVEDPAINCPAAHSA